MSSLPPLPTKPAGLKNARLVFERHAEEILGEWIDRTKNPPVRRAESPNAWFKRESYRLLKHYIEHGLTRVFDQLVKEDRRTTRTVEEATKNPFKLGLLAMLSDDGDLSRSNRHVFGNQMLYAWCHDVPEDFLNAFLAVTGGPAQVAAKIKAGQAEPGFEHRFVAERLLQG